MNLEHCLICECHLVEFEELKNFIKESSKTGPKIARLEDLKLNRIIGHGCGQCLKTWEHEIKLLLEENNLN